MANGALKNISNGVLMYQTGHRWGNVAAKATARGRRNGAESSRKNK